MPSKTWIPLMLVTATNSSSVSPIWASAQRLLLMLCARLRQRMLYHRLVLGLPHRQCLRGSLAKKPKATLLRMPWKLPSTRYWLPQKFLLLNSVFSPEPQCVWISVRMQQCLRLRVATCVTATCARLLQRRLFYLHDMHVKIADEKCS